MDADAWRQAKGVLAEALLRPPSERDALVVERCPDPLLRREVQAYLHQYDEDFLESVLTVSETMDSTAAAAAEAAEPPEVHPGDQIGPYVVLERLGVGGMGHVFLGSDTRLHRQVALKCLIASRSGGDLRSRILHEARAAARINHPNIAIVHDVIEHQDRPFLVMEYVEGESLAAFLHRERPTLERMLAMGRQLASALAAAHAKGIIHRDLKPANIQVTPDGSVKVLDFGVAQAMSMITSETTPETTTSTLPLSTQSTLKGQRGVVRHPGTPAYMSPEQMFGRPIDQRSDIYSLGVILYEMATGHRPYAADDPLDVVFALSRSLMPPVEETHLPAPVNDVIGKMLAVKPEDRFETATKLETALAVLTGPDPALPLQLPAARSRLLVAGTRVAGLTLASVLVVGALGFLTTAAFNLSLSRTAPFSNELPTVWLRVGLQSMVMPTVFVVGLFLAAWTIRFVVRLLSLSKSVDSFLTTSRARSQRLSAKLQLQDPVVMAQAVAGLGIIALVIVSVRFFDVLDATMTFWSTQSDIRQKLLVVQHTRSVANFRMVLDAFAVVFVAAAARIVQLRGRLAVRRGAGALTIVSLLLVLTVSLSALPYRLVYQSKADRVDAAGHRCYILGESPTELLLFCPDDGPPRTRRVSRGDPAIRRTGANESIFSPRSGAGGVEPTHE